MTSAVLSIMTFWWLVSVACRAFVPIDLASAATIPLRELGSVSTTKAISVPVVDALSDEPAPKTPTPMGVGMQMYATGYCSCVKCCGKSNGITASGIPAHVGTIAAPKGWAFGSQYLIKEIPGVVFTVEDRGGAITGNVIDIWFPTHAEALLWGRRPVTLIAIY